MKIIARTDTGLVRENNQDSYTAFELDGAVIAVVCDGMGGAAEGALASNQAVMAIKEYITERYYSDMSDISIKTLLIAAVESANRFVFNLSRTDEKYFGMGTTAVVAIVKDNELYITHVGDSRAYKKSGDNLYQLTKDHSIIQRMIENGEISAEEALKHPDKHIITRALGVDDVVRVDFCQETFFENDVLILCTDGLINHVSNEDIVNITADDCYHNYADRLVNLANSNGGRDNITVVIVEY
ncbi:MAG: Stp1/IreP family PP2C-type Ser/Thr phosphatase [Clostridia bacterium]|nr:Stp1/IreP family PP2C-type Ser/Thr phosphatase [Clostridia bacterium]